MKKYSVKALADLAGISVRTLHVYDKKGLLKPAIRTDKKYRLYGENELLRLQQILFFKELGFDLARIREILDKPDFDQIRALIKHKKSLLEKRKQLEILTETIDKTINTLKRNKMISHDELYHGFAPGVRKKVRQQAIDNYGVDQIKQGEDYLKRLTKDQFEALKKEQVDVMQDLLGLMKEDLTSSLVQLSIAKHYQITRKFWGTYGSADLQKEQYKGLGELYLSTPEYTMVEGNIHDGFPEYLCKAMKYFVKTQLK